MTGLLLDTHAAIWWWTDDPRLSPAARRAIGGETPAHLSAASVWEVAIKSAAGRLPEIEDFPGQYRELLADSGFVLLPVDDRAALAAAYLPGQHRDPFDRVVAAQAPASSLTVVTRDPQIAAFGCEVLW